MRGRSAIVSCVAGVIAFLTWVLPLPWASFLVVFGALDQLQGPFGLPWEWIDSLPGVAWLLGVVAIGVGAAQLLGRGGRILGIGSAAVLVTGAVYVVAWIVDPPDGLPGSGTFTVWPYVAAGALVVAAIAQCVALRGAGRPASP